ncbi:glycosyltransferase family 2 protein [Actinacidiphila paucisporea]|uniref:Glycosyltransferase, GT2 family n=1 Tax=Actinacidiphila paucisporea TaxID=310782 RepID=A0A1M6X1H9_9ACTN|nr:glycosyltransferase [Actinacidiphila paucisporea]SHK99786.1 Glycosyltransferase, GT2 family [Actinacidiphila paucisporea]
MDTIDIMLPHYGDTGLLQLAVNSILDQSDKDWRLTVVDDGREPGVPEWFASLDDERVRYQRNEQNLGITRNFRKCVDLVEHSHFVMMGSDDLMLPDYVATIRSMAAAAPDAAMYQPGVQVIDEHGEPVKTLVDEVKRRLYAPDATKALVLGGEPLATNLLSGNWLYFPSVCWRSDIVKKISFREDLSVIQDLALVIDLVQRGEQLAVDPTVCFRYRRHSTSLSSHEAMSGARFGEARRYFAGVADAMDEHGWHKAARAARRHVSMRLHALSMVPGALRSRQFTALRTLLTHAFAGGRKQPAAGQE